MADKQYNIHPANRLETIQEYYFSRKLKEVAQMNAEGKNVINLGIGSPDMPPSTETLEVLTRRSWLSAIRRYLRTSRRNGFLLQKMVQC